MNTCSYNPYVTCSLTRGLVCRLQLLLVLDSPIILGSASRGIRDHILLSQIRDFSTLEGEIPVFISPRNRVVHLYTKALGSIFFVSYDSQGYLEVLDSASTRDTSNPIGVLHKYHCLCLPPITARQWLGVNFTAATNTPSKIE
jgi:hypothetical protein